MRQTRLQRAWSAWLELPQGLRPGVLVAGVIVFLFLFLMAVPSHAGLIAKNGRNELRLGEDACTNETILPNIRPEWRDKFKSAKAEVDGKHFEACYIDTGQGHYFVMYDDGDSQVVPITIFHESSV